MKECFAPCIGQHRKLLTLSEAKAENVSVVGLVSDISSFETTVLEVVMVKKDAVWSMGSHSGRIKPSRFLGQRHVLCGREF